jgi:hypothetical protein
MLMMRVGVIPPDAQQPIKFNSLSMQPSILNSRAVWFKSEVKKRGDKPDE